jgi:hypothetical protein
MILVRKSLSRFFEYYSCQDLSKNNLHHEILTRFLQEISYSKIFLTKILVRIFQETYLESCKNLSKIEVLGRQ